MVWYAPLVGPLEALPWTVGCDIFFRKIFNSGQGISKIEDLLDEELLREDSSKYLLNIKVTSLTKIFRNSENKIFISNQLNHQMVCLILIQILSFVEETRMKVDCVSSETPCILTTWNADKMRFRMIVVACRILLLFPCV